MKTTELIGAALDWAVAKCHKEKPFMTGHQCCEADDYGDYQLFTPSTNWAQGGLIIEREKIELEFDVEGWWAQLSTPSKHYHGQTPLIAAMRCYVANKLGEDVDIPEELKNV